MPETGNWGLQSETLYCPALKCQNHEQLILVEVSLLLLSVTCEVCLTVHSGSASWEIDEHRVDREEQRSCVP